jgi:hypothetical protein
MELRGTLDKPPEAAECRELPNGEPCHVYWPKSCYQGAWGVALFPGGRIWAPPGNCQEQDTDYNFYATWASSQPWPDGLKFVMVRAKKGHNYGINIFGDGRTLWQSLSCARDRSIHASILSRSDVQRLSDAFVAANFNGRSECAPFVDDTSIVVLGLAEGNVRKVVYETTGYMDTLPDLIDAVVGSSRWRE